MARFETACLQGHSSHHHFRLQEPPPTWQKKKKILWRPRVNNFAPCAHRCTSQYSYIPSRKTYRWNFLIVPKCHCLQVPAARCNERRIAVYPTRGLTHDDDRRVLCISLMFVSHEYKISLLLIYYIHQRLDSHHIKLRV